jgi:hypothetical protein
MVELSGIIQNGNHIKMDKGFNIIVSDHKTCKTTFIWQISKLLRDSGKRLFFIGGTREMQNNNQFLKIFDHCIFNISDIRYFQLVYQRQNEYDYLIIDDINLIEPKFIKELKKFDKIIATCANGRENYYIRFSNSKQKFNVYNIIDDYIVLPSGEEVTKSAFLRDYKINLIINE